MAARPQETRERAVPRLYLITPLVTDAAAIADALAAMVEVADIAAVLLRLADDSEGTLTKRIKALAPVVQKNGAALLLDARADFVARGGADGAHLTGIDALQAALPGLKPGRIAGAGGLATRHDAMLAAETGADYVLFGEPAPDGTRPAFEWVHDRVEWWAELFEVPCVGFAASLDEVAALAALGADFVAIGDLAFADSSGPEAAVRAASRLLVPEPAG
jgi:thiamine-phosphate pyrophosphorylase